MIKMTTCKVRRWSLMNTDLQTLASEIESFLNDQEVRTMQTFIIQGQLMVVAVFGNA